MTITITHPESTDHRQRNAVLATALVILIAVASYGVVQAVTNAGSTANPNAPTVETNSIEAPAAVATLDGVVRFERAFELEEATRAAAVAQADSGILAESDVSALDGVVRFERAFELEEATRAAAVEHADGRTVTGDATRGR